MFEGLAAKDQDAGNLKATLRRHLTKCHRELEIALTFAFAGTGS